MVKEFLERGNFKVILNEEVSPDRSPFPGRFAMKTESTEAGKPKFTARFVVEGNLEKLKNLMIHSSQTLQPSSVRFILGMAIAHEFDVWTSDVFQAYLQTDCILIRKAFINNPPAEFEPKANEFLHLLKPL